MDEANERIQELRQHTGLSQKAFGELLGFTTDKIRNIENGKQKIGHDVYDQIAKHWPQFHVWITTGRTYPNDGQISPQIERARKELGAAGQAGK